MKKFEKSYGIKSGLGWVLTLLVLLTVVDLIGITIGCIILNHGQMGEIISAVITATWKERVGDIVLYTIIGALGILFVVKSLKNAHAIDESKLKTGRMAILVAGTVLVVDVCVFVVEIVLDCTEDFCKMWAAILQNPTNVAIIISINVAIVLVAVICFKMGKNSKRGKRESSPK